MVGPRERAAAEGSPPVNPALPAEEAAPANPAAAADASSSAAHHPLVDPASALLAQARSDARSRGRSGPTRRTPGRSTSAIRTGSSPDDRDPQELSAALGRLLAQRGWEVDVAVHSVMARWPEIVGPEVAAHCRPERFDDGELTVRTDSTAWATQLRLLAPQLVRRLNLEVGDSSVRAVTVRGPDAPRWTHGQRSVRGRGPRDTYG